MSSRILIVEDEAKLAEHVAQLLKAESMSVELCTTFAGLAERLTAPHPAPDAVVLDRLLQGRDSAELLTQMKRRAPEAKILILSAINTSSEKAALLNAGADDYLAKPFDGAELVARLRVLLRRSTALLHLKLGNLALDLEKRSLKVNEAEIPLTNREFALLKTFVQAPGRIFNKAYLYEKVWEMSADVESNVAEATVNKLRRRLEEAGASVRIKNARNLGYWLEE